IYVRPLHRLPHHNRAKLSGAEVGKRSLEFPNRRAHAGNDDDFVLTGHAALLLSSQPFIIRWRRHAKFTLRPALFAAARPARFDLSTTATSPPAVAAAPVARPFPKVSPPCGTLSCC